MVLHGSSSSSLSSITTNKPSLAPSSSSNNSATLYKLTDDPSSFGSMLDQLHAEQKGTIEALTCQVEFYRQREERARQELVMLRRCLPLAKGEDSSAVVAKLASENRTLGDEVDGLRAKKSSWDRDRTRLERQTKEMERQLKDAKRTLTGFSQAIEQLEVKMQRKEAEVQTRCLELEHALGTQKNECEQLQRDKQTMQQELENLQTASNENTRLRTELRTLLHRAGQSVNKDANNAQLASEISSISDTLKSLEDTKGKQEAEIQKLQQQLATAAAELVASQCEVERKNSEVKELQLKLDNSTNILTLREQWLASDESSNKEHAQEFSAVVSLLQREKSDLQSKLSTLHRDHEAIKTELQCVKSRLSAKDHSVLVSTLRSEVAALKERFRTEFRHEQDCMKTEAQALKHEITLLRGRLADKDLAARDLGSELARKETQQKQIEYNVRQLEEQSYRLKTELEQSHSKYQQLQQCRTTLVEQLDVGFKELLNDEDSAALAHKELATLRHDFRRMEKEKAVLETERQTLTDELARIDRIHSESLTRQMETVDNLYSQLAEKEHVITSLKSAERQAALLQQEKEAWEGTVTDVRLRCESRVEVEVRKADELRARIAQLEQEIVSLTRQVKGLEAERAQWTKTKHTAELSHHQKAQEVVELKRDVTRLTNELDAATARLKSGRHEISIREQKLLKERTTMAHEMVQLVHRIEGAGQRNAELGAKVVALANQSKVDQTDLVALSSQMKCYKDQVKTLETQLGQIHRRNAQDSDTVRDLHRKLHDVTCLKESYQGEINNLRQMLEHVQSDYSVVKRQRDEAVKRIRLLAQCRDDMKVTVEDHTAELVEEIEALQHQMDSERNRCAVLLANEKTLLRDLQERNTAITTLQHSLSVLQHQSQDKSRCSDQFSRLVSSSRRRSRGSNSTGSPVSSSNQSTVPTTSTLSPHRHHQHLSQSQPQPQQLRSSSAVRSVTPAKEMEHLLSNLEHISYFSAQM